MTTQTLEDQTYTMGYSEAFMKLLYRRNANENAGHLLPLLRPGMTVLDLGCGPGQISIGLAHTVSPGVVHGVDYEQNQVKLAYENSNIHGVHNVVFTQEDATHLDLLSNSFDVVHCHAFLMHAQRIPQVLSEAYRVLKPGGIMSAREMDVPTSYIAPSNTRGTVIDMLGTVMEESGGHPTLARDLKKHLILAGFRHVSFGASADVFDSPEDIRFLEDFLNDWALSEEMKERAMEIRKFSHLDFIRWKNSVQHWANDPAAVGVFQFCHATGYKIV